MKEDKPLLAKIKQLVELNNVFKTEFENPDYHRQCALAFQALGLHSIAKYENRLRAEKEQKTDIEFYNKDYDDSVDFAYFEQNYAAEKQSFYYETLAILIQIDHYFFKPLNAVQIIKRGGSLASLGLYYFALRDYDFILDRLDKNSQEYAICCINKAYILNLFGEYQEGWALHEKRWETGQEGFKDPIQFPCPRWQGESFSPEQGKLLVHAEQGIGDSIQFVRYVLLLKQLGVEVMVWNNRMIDDFLRFNLAKYDIPCAVAEESAELAYEIPMMSLPYLFKQRVENIPLTRKYLESLPAYNQKWQNKVKKQKGKLNIGVVWSSISGTRTAKQRNISLAKFKKLFELDANFHCLQKAISKEDLDELKTYKNVHTYHTEIDSFCDTASIVEQLDLIISVDTSVAHLSAAMGKPTWILIIHKPDFRWLLNREDSIWYDSVRLFRQALDYDWEPVLDRVFVAVNDLVEENKVKALD